MATTMRPLPVAHDDVVDADLDVRLSTPSTLVVHARLVTGAPGAGGEGGVELALVIPRSRCRGERPLAAALLEAARAAVARATRAGVPAPAHPSRRVVTQVAGRPHLIFMPDAG
ncbi:hypothetical protein [Roseateles sp. LKC17W]